MAHKRKPCVGCGGEKGPGARRKYCAACSEARRWRCPTCGDTESKPAWAKPGSACLPCLRTKDSPERRLRRADAERAKRYGLTLEELDALLARSDVCESCGKPPSGKRASSDMRLAIDHCHETGRVRGLLCGPCNRALGALGDNAEGVLKMLAYLARAEKTRKAFA